MNADPVADASALRAIGDVLAAVADAHTPRALVRAIATSLSAHVALRRVELRASAPIAIVERERGRGVRAWRSVEPAPDPRAELLAPGLAVIAARELPPALAARDFRVALGHVIATATRHAGVVQRVATLSRRAHAESRELRADLARVDGAGGASGLVARSAAMRDAVARARLVAAHPTTVLLAGESGSGKEVLAREIHRCSPRAHRPLVQLNCGAIPEGLVESELFGHERGAFTGAERRHAGVFERAHRGTLLLDEIGELPLAAQVKLLRVLQERQIRRVGGTDIVDVDVRVIAATNRSLAALVERGAFREDLYYRLDVFSIRVPPLRERRGDLAPLAAALVEQLAQRLGVAAPPVTRAVLAKLDAHDWPGNVRELANALEAALILGGGRALELPEALAARARGRPDPSRFDSAVRAALEEALRATRGKIYGADGAAARLGLKPGTLQSKLRKLRISRADFC